MPKNPMKLARTPQRRNPASNQREFYRDDIG
jgi:hypothetical protein